MKIKLTFLSRFVLGLCLFIPLFGFAQLQSPLDIALRHLEQNRESLELTSQDIKHFRVSDLYQTKHNGVTHIYLNQQHAGIDVRNALINVNILPNGEVLNMGNRFMADLASRVNSAQPALDSEQALLKVLDHLQLGPESMPTLKERKSEHAFIYNHQGLALEPIKAQYNFSALRTGSRFIVQDCTIPSTVFRERQKWKFSFTFGMHKCY